MKYSVEFDRLLRYDIGKIGISVNVQLKLADTAVSLDAKVDSGASFCIFSKEAAEDLGLDVKEGDLKIFTTATGTFQAFGHWVTLIVDEFEFDSQVFFHKTVGSYPNVLGRQGWLDRVIIGINDYEGKLYLKQHES